jgi:hypothetical protein
MTAGLARWEDGRMMMNEATAAADAEWMPRMAGELYEHAGGSLTAAQDEVIAALYAAGPDGRPKSGVVAACLPPGEELPGLHAAVVLAWLFLEERQRILWSAPGTDACRHAHQDLADLITGVPELAAGTRISWANGAQEIRSATGSVVRFRARRPRRDLSLRGVTGRRVLVTEARELSDWQAWDLGAGATQQLWTSHRAPLPDTPLASVRAGQAVARVAYFGPAGP